MNRRNLRHGYFGTPTYSTWIEMRRRCNDPNRKDYKRYGGRGIQVCCRWNHPTEGFLRFLSDMGERPSLRHTLGRLRNGGNYTPGNCQWQTVAVQNENRSNSLKFTYRGVRKTLKEWAESLGKKYETLQSRRRRGWRLSRVLGDPVQSKQI